MNTSSPDYEELKMDSEISFKEYKGFTTDYNSETEMLLLASKYGRTES